MDFRFLQRLGLSESWQIHLSPQSIANLLSEIQNTFSEVSDINISVYHRCLSDSISCDLSSSLSRSRMVRAKYEIHTIQCTSQSSQELCFIVIIFDRHALELKELAQKVRSTGDQMLFLAIQPETIPDREILSSSLGTA